MASGAEILLYLNMTRYYNERQRFGVPVKCGESESEPCSGPVFIWAKTILTGKHNIVYRPDEFITDTTRATIHKRYY